MKVIEVLIEVPCFKCLYANPIMESHLHCNPNSCEKLTEWLLLQVKQDRGKGEQTASLTIAQAEATSCP
jgi:hypothetical protein